MSTDEQDHDPSKDKDDKTPHKPPHRQVVVTHYGKKKKNPDDVPPEIMPTAPTHIVSSPVDVAMAQSASSQVPTQENKVTSEKTVPSGAMPQPPVEKPVPPPPPTIRIPPRDFDAPIPESIQPKRAPTLHEPSYSQPQVATASYREQPMRESMEVEEDVQSPDQGGRNGGGSGAALFFSLLATAAVSGLMIYAYFSEQQLNELQQQSRDDKASVEAIASEAKNSLAQLDDLKTKHQAQQNSLQVLKTQLEGAQTKLVDLSGKSEWVLSEANYLAFMANERLRAAQDVQTALMQLQEADNRLATLGNPAFNWVREAIAKDIAKLQTHPRVNRQTLWESLAQISTSLNQLHFKSLQTDPFVPSQVKEEGPDTNAPKWRQMLWKSWQELKELISVTRESDNPIPVALTSQDQSQILRTMQLMCEQAQWAILQGDSKIYLSSLASLRSLTDKYFESDAQKETLLGNIARLEQQRVEITIPDISDSIRALSQAMLDLNQKTTKTSVQVPVPVPVSPAQVPAPVSASTPAPVPQRSSE